MEAQVALRPLTIISAALEMASKITWSHLARGPLSCFAAIVAAGLL